MRRTIISFSLLLPVVTGLVFLANLETSVIAPTVPNTPTLTHPGSSDSDTTGQVVANDETGFSGPRQDSRNESAYIVPSPNVAKSTPKKTDKTVVINNKEYPLRTYTTLAIPNDPLASQPWVTNTKLDQAWDTPRGSTPTLLAVIDTGFGLKHEEFTNRLYVNPGESGAATLEGPSSLNCTDRGLPVSASCNLVDENNDQIVDNETGLATYQNPSKLNCTGQSRPTITKDCNQIDDDSNGLVDDVNGWDFINHDSSSQAGQLNPIGDGTTHGTQVAGIAAATGNNAKGIAGVDWETKILPIQALDDDSYGDTLSVGRSIYYAVAQGADVISLSLGSALPDNYVREAVQAALAKGIVVVAASGNDGCDCIVYPANYPEVVAVGALNASSLPASFSSYGLNLDILAPGTSMTSSTWTSSNPTAAYVSGINGTSFATPIVGGLLTRILSQRPNATPAQLIAALTESVNRLSLSPTIPHDIRYGFGTVDAFKTSNRMLTPQSPQQLYAFSPVSGGNKLNPGQPSEQPSTDLVHHCEPGIVPSTAVFELTKPGLNFFGISKVEASQAVGLGYTSNFFAYACLQQPHDTATNIRTIDLFREFRNVFNKL